MIFHLVPHFSDRARLLDEVARCIWYFEMLREEIDEVRFYYVGTDLTTDVISDILRNPEDNFEVYYDPLIYEWASLWCGKIIIIHDPHGEYVQTRTHEAQGVLVWSMKDGYHKEIVNSCAKRYTGLYAEADTRANPIEAVNRVELPYLLISIEKRKAIDALSKRALLDLYEQINGAKLYLFGTAPSISQVVAANYDYGDGVSVVCNSLIRNKKLMNSVNPRVLICGDPVFHAGPSRYAAAYRKDLMQTMANFDVWLVTHSNFVPIMRNLLGEKYYDRIIGIRTQVEIDINLNLLESLSVLTTENILTMQMLPVACTLSDDINILGCDGRSFLEESYFWKHDKTSQYDEHMEETKLVHPSFFERDFNNYYLTHCATVERTLSTAESAGKTIRMITPSYIPPLAKRYQAVM